MVGSEQPVATEPRASGWQVFRRVLREQDAHWRAFVAILALGVILVPLSLVPPYGMKLAVDSYLGDAPLPGPILAWLPDAWRAWDSVALVVAIGLVVVTALLKAGLDFVRSVLQERTKQRLVLGFRRRLFPHVERLSLTYHDEKGAADSTFRVLLDTEVIPAIVLDGLLPFVASLALVCVLAVVIVTLSFKLALVALAIAPIMLLVSWPYGRRLRAQWHEIKEIDTSAMALLQEVFSSVRVIKAFGREEYETARLIQVAKDSMDAKVRVAVTHGKFNAWIGTLFAIGTAAVVGVGFFEVKSGSLSLGEFLMVATLLAQLYSPLQLVVGQIASLQSSFASAERALNLLDEVPEVVERPDARPLGRARGAVVFDGVSFGYEPGTDVLHEVSFEVAAGARIGIAGPTGSGKTTMMNLLTRLFDPKRGTIRLDGVDLRELVLADLRRQFSIVLQEPVLFKKSIAANIAYGIQEARHEDIVAAAKLANAHAFISGFPDGYDTVVGERGQRLSGGERQRISLARAFLKDSPMLILDEPTSSVDMRTEAAILDACKRLMEGRTTFIIAHRSSTLAECDKVLVIDRGRIVQFAAPASVGSLDDLMMSVHEAARAES